MKNIKITNKNAVVNIPKQMGKYIPYRKQTTTKKLSRQTRILRNKTYEIRNLKIQQNARKVYFI